MHRFKFVSVLFAPIALLASVLVIGADPGSPTEAVPAASTREEITADIAVTLLGNWRKTGEGSATADLSGNTVLTIGSGSFHTNGTLKVQSPSQLISDGIVSAKRDLVCTNPNDPLCLPPQADDRGPQVTDPLSFLPGPPNVGGRQPWPSCNDSCSVAPGRYDGPYNINAGVEVLLSPGYYRFTNQILNLGGTLRVDSTAAPHPETGMGVMLFFESNSSLEIGSQGSLQFDPPEGGPYENVGIYYNRGNQNTLGWRASSNDMPGWVYAKNGHLRLNNDADWTVNNRFVFRTMNSQGGNFTIDPNGSAEPPFEPVADVSPIFECYIEEPDGSYTAYFGFENLTAGEDGAPIPTEIPLGEANNLTPASFDGEQPSTFGLPGVVDGRPGRTAFGAVEPNAFVVTGWDGSDLVWTLNGSTATAGLSTNCPSQPDLGPKCFEQTPTILGTDEDDVLVGTEGDDVIYVGLGNDVVDGLGGNDLICGAEGEDVLNGNDGDDRVDGGQGHDVVDGGAGTDELIGGDGDDALLGGDDADTVLGGPGDDVLRGDAGDDQLNDNDPIDTDRDAVDGGEGDDVCDVDADDTEEAC